MAMNLDAVLKIAAKVTGLTDLGALEKGLVGAEKAANAAKSGFKAMVDSSAWQAAAAAAAGLGVGIGLSVKSAIAFEESMAEVRKVVEGIDTPQGLKEIRNEIFELSREIPITQKGFAEMYAAAGQAGVPRAELKAFATDVAKVAIAFDMTAGQAGDSMAKLRSNLGLTQPELMKLADAANYLSNNMASSGAEIVDFMLRAGAAGKQAGMSAEQTAAFGSAMLSSGAASDVAATSFRNMVGALSRGASMTARQTEALVTLGYGQTTAANKEQQLTRAVEEQSRRRLETYQKETNDAITEINRRYRDSLQIMEDAWEDEQDAYASHLGKQLNAQSKALNRQREDAIDAANARADANGTSAKEEIRQINDFYDAKIEALREANDAEMKQQRRNARDYQQQVKDQLDDQKALEVDAVQEKYKELQVIEEARKKVLIEEAKATAAELSNAMVGKEMASKFQADAVGTIREVFNKIKALPAEMQMSVISDLFGDEARALLPLINNTALLEQALGLVGDQSKYAGSTADEFKKRMSTTAAQMQLAQNSLNELSITVGTTFVPAINAVLGLFKPLLEGIGYLAREFPLLTGVVGALVAAFIALVALAPFITSFITLLGALQAANIGGLIAGWAGALLPLKAALGGFVSWAASSMIPGLIAAFSGFLSWVAGTLIPGLLAFFSGPVGWTILAVAAVVAMCIAFREPIGKFFSWLGTAIGNGLNAVWKWGEPIKKFFSDVWEGVKKITGGVWESIVKGVKGAFRGVLQYVANQVNSVARLINRLIQTFNRLPGPDIPLIPTLSVPAFADGGVVSGPTLAMVGEGGEPEYIIPQSKMAKASMNYLNGARGGAVIPAFAQGGFVGGNAQINVTTGPVMQQNGQQYVTVGDLEKAMRKTADGVYASLRTPAGRYAVGTR